MAYGSGPPNFIRRKEYVSDVHANKQHLYLTSPLLSVISDYPLGLFIRRKNMLLINIQFNIHLDSLFQKSVIIPWAHSHLLLQVCLESRNWPGGAFVTDTIISSVQQSKRTVLLVSENYFESPWCQYQFTAAHYQVSSVSMVVWVQDE